MKLKSFFIAPAATALSVLCLYTAGYSAEAPFRNDFIKALEENNAEKASAVIDANKASITGEIKAIIDEAVKAPTPQERDSKLYLGEIMARYYLDLTGDAGPAKELKKAGFDAKLSPAAKSTADGGVHKVEFPDSGGAHNYVFKPDNIVIKKGETVRWTNSDTVPHIFATMPVIGMTGVKSPSIAPGAAWEFKFEKPGEYYLICFVHRGMIGKVTVEE